MDYEKLYKEALERANMIYNDKYKPEIAAFAKKSLETIFPELVESEDERVRGAIIDHLKDNNLTEWAAWLEKQEHVDEDKVVKGVRRGVATSLMHYIDANTKGMCLSNMECVDIENAIISEDWDKVYCYMKKKLENNSLEGHYLLNLDFLDKKQVEEIENIVYGWNKVEPKFKVGDKVYEVIDGIECTIESIDETTYYGDTTNFDIKDQDKWELI